MKSVAALKYPALTLAFASLASGSIIAAGMDSFDTIGYRIFWMLIPLTALFLALMAVNLRFAVPRLLLRDRLPAYCLCMLFLSYLLPLTALGMEYVLRRWLALPPRITSWDSPWILVDTFCNSILLFLIMAGLGFMTVYGRWRSQLIREERCSDSLGRYITQVRELLNPEVIFSWIDRIIGLMNISVQEANGEITSLCRYLRRQLYELPQPSVVMEKDNGPDDSAVIRVFLSRKWRAWRHCLFQGVLLIISLGVFFNTPDCPEFTWERFAGFLSMFLFFDIIAYIDILWLYPGLEKNGDLRRYVRNTAILIAAVIIPLIAIQIITYEPEPYTKLFPLPIMIISTVGTVVTVALFLCGVSAALALRNWLRGRRRLTLLKAEYVRQEYAFLRKQINPHFLFNVLNNAGILSEEEPAESERMLRELRRLLVYQFEETGRMVTPLGNEIDFLRSYLALEATRIEPFEFSVEVEGEIGHISVPTLLFIPFVENAVKYSAVTDGRRSVRLTFSSGPDGILFRCSNTFREGISSGGRPGGLGLANTLRRLELLYGGRAVISRRIGSGNYMTTLFLPYDELHNR